MRKMLTVLCVVMTLFLCSCDNGTLNQIGDINSQATTSYEEGELFDADRKISDKIYNNFKNAFEDSDCFAELTGIANKEHHVVYFVIDKDTKKTEDIKVYLDDKQCGVLKDYEHLNQFVDATSITFDFKSAAYQVGSYKIVATMEDSVGRFSARPDQLKISQILPAYE